MTNRDQPRRSGRALAVSRRATLKGLGAVLLSSAVVPLLAACGQSATTAGATTSGAAASGSASASSLATTSAAPATSSTGASSAATTSAVSATSATAASAAAPTSAAVAAPAAQPGTLNLFVGKINTPPGAQDALLKTLIADFEQKNSGVKVAYNTYNSAAEESSKIETSVASSSGPDIFEFGSTLVPTAAATGAFVVLTDSLWNTLGGKSKFFAAQLKMSGLTPSSLIAVPEYMLPFALVYNTELLQAAGAKPPTTWTEFVDAAKKMTDTSKDQWGTVMDPSDPFDPWHILWVLARQMGGDFVTEDMKTATMTSDPVYKAFRFWFDWIANYKIAKPSDATFKGPDLLNNFAGGKVGFMVMQGPTTIPTLDKSAVKGKYAFTPMPTVPYGMSSIPSGGVPVQTFVSGQYLTITKFSKLQDDAILWMKYVTDVTQQMQFLKTYGYMPAITGAYNQPELQTPVWKAFVTAENNAYATPLTGAWGPIETIVGGVASKIAAEYATNSYKAGDLKSALAATNSAVQTALSAQTK